MLSTLACIVSVCPSFYGLSRGCVRTLQSLLLVIAGHGATSRPRPNKLHFLGKIMAELELTEDNFKFELIYVKKA